KQSEAITSLAAAIRTPVPITPNEVPIKKSGPGLGYSLTATDLRSDAMNKNNPDRKTLFTDRDSDLEKRLGKIDKRVYKLEKIELQQNRRLTAIETKLNGLDITAYAYIVFSEFSGNKLNQKVIAQIKQDATKFNERVAADEEKVAYQIDVTAYDNKGRYSKKKSQVFADELKKHLSSSFSVELRESSNIDAKLANRAKINVPF
ncbi:MAG: hypothetical protein Q7T50_07175, partial [Candidatus Magasanikbacteria bacterium]|nr:hypothetical protein [Candidatus Magasanikbacteria bacterium]